MEEGNNARGIGRCLCGFSEEIGNREKRMVSSAATVQCGVLNKETFLLGFWPEDSWYRFILQATCTYALPCPLQASPFISETIAQAV